MTDTISTINVGDRPIHFRMWNSKGQPYNLCQSPITTISLWASTKHVVTCEECSKRLRK